eukprot:GHVT01054319.1.p1 GENE.GHVT01054319.1~~GHVT01054319.1.p1  ORF type:complete len:209 (+),score=7.22 GHVT01054319.1:343-969(+)
MVAKHALNRPVKASAPSRVASIAPISKQLRRFSKPQRYRLRGNKAKFCTWAAISIALLGGCSVIVNNCMKAARRRPQPEANEANRIFSTDRGLISAATSVGFDLRACNSVSLKAQEFAAHYFPSPGLSFSPPFDDVTRRCAFLPMRLMEKYVGIGLLLLALAVPTVVLLVVGYAIGSPQLMAAGFAILSIIFLHLFPWCLACQLVIGQ